MVSHASSTQAHLAAVITGQRSTYSSARPVPSLFLIASLLLTLGLLLLILLLPIAASLSQDPVEPANPFLDYAQIMPGQPASALSGFGCIIWRQNPYRQTCSIFPSQGSFHLITVRARQDLDLIEEATFFSDSLAINRLYALFGSAVAIERSERGRPNGIRWQADSYSITLPLPRGPHMPTARSIILRQS